MDQPPINQLLYNADKTYVLSNFRKKSWKQIKNVTNYEVSACDI